MTSYGFTNADGEPIMDGASYRYEQYIDSTYEPDPDDYMGYNDEPECDDDHECQDCDGPGGGLGWTCSWCGRDCPMESHDQTPAEW